MADVANQMETMDQLKKLGLINEDTYAAAKSLAPKPVTESPQDLVAAAQSAPVRPEYAGFKEYEKGLNKNSFFMAPDQTQEKMNELDRLRSMDKNKLSQPETARLRELESMSQTAPSIENRGPSSVLSVQSSAPVSAQPDITNKSPTATGEVLVDPLTGLKKQINKQIGSSFDQQQQAVNMAAKAAEAKAKEEISAIQSKEKVYNDAAAQQLLDQDAKQKVIQDNLDKMKSLSDDLVNSKIDPDRYMNSRTTGQKIMMGIGMVLGGFDPSGNTAVKIVQGAIDRDLASQKQEYEAKIQKGLMADNIYSRTMQMYGDSEKAKIAARDAMLQGIQTKLDVAASKYSGASAVAAAKNTGALITKERAMLADQMVKQTELSRARNDLNGISSSDQDMRVQRMENAINSLPLEEADEKRGRVVRGQGVWGLAPSKSDKDKIQPLLNDVETARSGIDELLSMDDGFFSSGKISPETRAKAQTIRVLLTGKLKEPITGGGTMSDTDREQILKALADPTSFSSVEGRARLESLKGFLDKGLAITLKNAGIRNIYQNPNEAKERVGFRQM